MEKGRSSPTWMDHQDTYRRNLGSVIGLDSSQSVWNALKEAYAQDSQEREFTLRQ
jgi:hypothetical protein